MQKGRRNPTQCEVDIMRTIRDGCWTTRRKLEELLTSHAARTVRNTVTRLVQDGVIEEQVIFPTNLVRWQPNCCLAAHAQQIVNALEGADEVLQQVGL